MQSEAMTAEGTQLYEAPAVFVIGAVEQFTLVTSPGGTQKIGGSTDTQGKRNKP
jgi:hypothetical protein